MPEVFALVPMRHDSERVPGKNYRPFAGRPLFHHIVSTLLEVPSVAGIVIDTDSETIRQQVQDEFPAVTLLERPPSLRDGAVPMTAVLQHDARAVDAPWFIQTHSTNPLLRPESVQAALDAFFTQSDSHDSLFSVTRLQTRLYDAGGQALNHAPEVLLRTQDLAPVFEENSNLYVFSRDLIIEHGRRIGDRPMLFEIDALEALDIDTETDFRLAEAVYSILSSAR